MNKTELNVLLCDALGKLNDAPGRRDVQFENNGSKPSQRFTNRSVA